MVFLVGASVVVASFVGSFPAAAAVGPAASAATDSANSAPGSYRPLTPARLLDTRIGLGARKGAVTSDGRVTLAVLGRDGVPASGVSAVVLNVTATGELASGFLTVFPTGRA
jgi:hypothetical protein